MPTSNRTLQHTRAVANITHNWTTTAHKIMIRAIPVSVNSQPTCINTQSQYWLCDRAAAQVFQSAYVPYQAHNTPFAYFARAKWRISVDSFCTFWDGCKEHEIIFKKNVPRDRCCIYTCILRVYGLSAEQDWVWWNILIDLIFFLIYMDKIKLKFEHYILAIRFSTCQNWFMLYVYVFLSICMFVCICVINNEGKR